MTKEIEELKEVVLDSPEPEQLREFGDIYARASEVAEQMVDDSPQPEIMYVYI